MTEQTAITTALMPAMDIGQAVARYRAMNEFVQAILKVGTDYGVIPGTGNKPALLKAGAEKLTSFFGLHPTYEIIEKAEDWTGKDHGGEPFFYYHYRCRLWRGGEIIAEGDGSCNSWESKYRYRDGKRLCPNCGQPTIIKGKAEFGGGWLCYAKKGGCGSKFKDNDKTITGQEVGRVLNPDVADQVNTIQKMAQKRALVAVTLTAANASDYFTQDIEDLAESYVDVEYRVVQPAPAEAPAQANPAPQTGGNGGPVVGLPVTAADLLVYVNRQVQVPYDNIAHLRRALAAEGLTGSNWPDAKRNPQWWIDAKAKAIQHAEGKAEPANGGQAEMGLPETT